MHRKGMSKRAIVKALGISRNSVRDIIEQGGEVSLAARQDQIAIPEDLLVQLYKECSGWRERMWEKLSDEHKIAVGYSTFTRKVRELGLGEKPRAAHVGDVPGAEMQQDTSPYRQKIAGTPVAVIACSLYFRYSKERYLKFYRSFDRFRMKSFFHEALSYFGYSAPECIIDNTNLAVLSGTGPEALINPEMVAFSRRYSFRFVPHNLGHSDRKAGEERSFWTVETNFFPGRTFSSLEDLNAQALHWATEIQSKRKRAKTDLIPAEAFKYETAFLQKLPEGLPAPYRPHDRTIDQYGFVAFAANYYWLPNGARGDVKVLEYAGAIKIYQGRKQLCDYPLPPHGTRGEIFPKERLHPYLPRHRPQPSAAEEDVVRAHSPAASAYLDFILKGTGALRHRLVREVHSLYRRTTPELFGRVVERAMRYRASDVKVLGDIARQLMRDDTEFVSEAIFDDGYEDRDEYNEGRITDLPDLKNYEQLLEDDDHER